MELTGANLPVFLLLMDQKQNRETLANWLGKRYRVIEATRDEDLLCYFDLAILDGMALTRLRQAVLDRKTQERPLSLPVFLATSRQLQINPGSYDLWQVVDEVINLPVDQRELAARLEIHLRARRLSLELAETRAELKSETVARLKTQHALNQLQSSFHHLVDSNLIGVVVTDRESRILEANTAFLNIIGLTQADVNTGEIRLRDLTPPELIAEFDRTMQTLQETSLTHPTLTDFLHKDGSRVTVMGASCLEKGAGSERYVSYALDLTERIKLETELKQLNDELEHKVRERTIQLEKLNAELESEITLRRGIEEDLYYSLEKEKELGELKSRFITMASHEFRTPLSSILTNAELLETYSHRWTEAKKQESLVRIQNSVQRMTRLLDDILLIGKTEAGKLEFNPRPLNLEVFCHEIINEFQLNEASRLIFTYSRNPVFAPEVDGTYLLDQHLLQQILTNLISNALKYSPPQSPVNFEVIVGETGVIFKVKDQGIGIPIEEQAHLFEPFHRAHNVGVISGTGLGLTIAKRAAELHGGTITYNSVPGEGTLFEIKLPLRPTPVTET